MSSLLSFITTRTATPATHGSPLRSAPGQTAGQTATKTAGMDWSAFQAIAKEVPLPPPGASRGLLTLADETLSNYAEDYQQYVAPWKHLVGIEIPNFYQFVIWHERTQPGQRTPPSRQAEIAAAH